MTDWKSVLRVAWLMPVVPSGLECVRYRFLVVVGWPVVAVMQVPESLWAGERFVTDWKSVLRVAWLTPVVHLGQECVRFGFLAISERCVF